MKIILSPINWNKKLKLEKQNDLLIINNKEYDFSDLKDSETLPNDAIDCDFIVGCVERINNEIEITILYPYQDSGHFKTPELNIKDGLLIDGVIL